MRHIPLLPLSKVGRTPFLSIALCLSLIFGAGGSAVHCAEPDDPMPVDQTPVDFENQIRPIIESRCIGCHGAADPQGGLDLSSAASAKRGGASGLPILKSPAESSELYHRLITGDRGYQMPADSEPLSKTEISLFRNWLNDGAHWPSALTIGENNEPAPDAFAIAAQELAIAAQKLVTPVDSLRRNTQIGLLGLVVASIIPLLISRLRSSANSQDTDVSKPKGMVTWALAGVVFLESLMLLGYRELVAKQSEKAMEFVKLQLDTIQDFKSQHLRESDLWLIRDQFGDPPQPVRLHNDEPSLARTYYRGNCERDPELFNGGNYRTGLFELSLTDREGNALKPGRSVNLQDLWIQLDLSRSPGTVERLYVPEMMSRMFMSHELHSTRKEPLQESRVRLETLKPLWKWRCRYPLMDYLQDSVEDVSGENADYEGVVYLQQGRIEDGFVESCRPHYAIAWKVEIANGTLAETSDVWMSSLFQPRVVRSVHARIPYLQWFSPNPIPEIDGENSKDPVKLGINDYSDILKETSDSQNRP